MPITKRAIKKLHHDRIRSRINSKIRNNMETIVKKARKSPNKSAVSLAFSSLDKAVKLHIIHKKAANRTKARLSKLLT